MEDSEDKGSLRCKSCNSLFSAKWIARANTFEDLCNPCLRIANVATWDQSDSDIDVQQIWKPDFIDGFMSDKGGL